MTLLAHFFRTAVRNVLRGGQRVLVAQLCIAFGVMSVVSMALLSEALENMLVVEPQFLIGGDVTMDRTVEETILPEHVAGLEALQAEGAIDRFTLIAYESSLVYRLPDSGELYFPSGGLGIDPASYPLMGNFVVSDPPDSTIKALLQQPGDLLVTRDLADEDTLRVGDRLLLSDLNVGAVVEGVIRGIVTDTPNHQGSKIYYSMETARQIAGGVPAENTALLVARDPTAVVAELRTQGWRAFSATELADTDRQVQEMIEFGLKGAGILGMLVGGIGIANTMQVLLRRRQRTVAVLKTIGYRQGQLQIMFAIEAALMGVLGSLLGAALGILISFGLVDLFSRTTNLLITWVFSPIPVLNGMLTGLVTTIAFAMFAIVVSSQVRPLALLRNEALTAERVPWYQIAALILLCALPFTAVTVLVMGSLLQAVEVLLFALAGLAILGGLLAGLVWLITRLLPLRAWPLVYMARNNLRRRGLPLVFAMIALFVGVVSLSMGVVITNSGLRALDERLIRFNGDNITIIAPADQEPEIRRAAETQPQIEDFSHSYQTSVRSIHVAGLPDNWIPPLLIGRTAPGGDLTISGAPWGSAPEGVYTFAMHEIAAGSHVEVTLPDGSTRLLPVVGAYNRDLQGASPQPAYGLLMTSSLSQSIAPPETVQFNLKAPSARVKQVSEALGAALPQATVINLPAYAARFTQDYQNLFTFAAAMAGLALLAGVLLIANSVSLAMLDRRYEIGVLKAMGYARRQVLFTLVVEYGLVALISTITGLMAVQIFLWAVSLANDLAGSLLVMAPSTALVITLTGVCLALLAVLGVAWWPTQVSPVVILNDRE